jgi:hypothetical protein
MSRLRALAPILLLSTLLTAGCSTSVSLARRDPPPAEMLKVPERPQLAPVDASDNELAEERIRIGAWGMKLERKLKDLVCYVLEKKPPC